MRLANEPSAKPQARIAVTMPWKLVAFSERVHAELMRLADGDAISVQGPFKAELYDKDGEKRLSLSIIADNVLALHQRLGTSGPSGGVLCE